MDTWRNTNCDESELYLSSKEYYDSDNLVNLSSVVSQISLMLFIKEQSVYLSS